MKHYGDITKLSGYTLPVVDVITGGSPCQDLSVAGKRAGLKGERSGLFMEQIRIVKEMREYDRLHNRRTGWNVRPRYMVWENVPGSFSSGEPKGADFAAVIEEIIKVAEPDADVCVCVPKDGWTKSGCYYSSDGRWSIAWRVHDAQFWGVPQRRKRIALVADFGGLSAPDILFERKGLRGDFTQSGEERESTSPDFEGGVGATSWTLKIRGGVEVDSAGKKAGKGALVQTERAGTIGVSQDQTLITIPMEGNGARPSHHGDGYGKEGDPMFSLNTTEQHKVAIGIDGYNQAVTGDVAMCLTGIATDYDHIPCVQTYGLEPGAASRMGNRFSEEVSPTLRAKMGDNQASVVTVLNDQGGSRMEVSEDIAGTLRSQEHGHQPIVYDNHATDARVTVCGETAPKVAARSVPGGNNTPLVYEHRKQDARVKELGDVAPTVEAAYGAGGNNTPLVVANGASGVVTQGNGEAWLIPEKATYLTLGGGQAGQGYPAVCIGNGQANQFGLSDKVGALNCMHDQQAVITYGIDRATFNQGANALYKPQITEELSATCVAKGPNAVYQSVVRRLTPLECERLQGYPDNYTDIGEWVDSKGKTRKTTDSARYKALGNSIALPFWFWLLRRISAQYERVATLGSLFSGLGGFELCWERCNGKGTALWGSEIEPFCIAVTKVRFPECTE